MLTDLKKNIDKGEIEHLPPFVYQGEITIVDQPEDVEEAINFLDSQPMLGFDTETRPSFRKGEIYQVSLLQLATYDRVFLFRLHKCGFGWPLRRLLENQDIVKIGVGIRDDLKHLQRIADFRPDGFVDLQEFAVNYGIEDKSLSKLMAIIFGVKISKRQRTSNWEAPQLSEAQLRYAATDAWGALKMYQRLLSEG